MFKEYGEVIRKIFVFSTDYFSEPAGFLTQIMTTERSRIISTALHQHFFEYDGLLMVMHSQYIKLF